MAHDLIPRPSYRAATKGSGQRVLGTYLAPPPADARGSASVSFRVAAVRERKFAPRVVGVRYPCYSKARSPDSTLEADIGLFSGAKPSTFCAAGSLPDLSAAKRISPKRLHCTLTLRPKIAYPAPWHPRPRRLRDRTGIKTSLRFRRCTRPRNDSLTQAVTNQRHRCPSPCRMLYSDQLGGVFTMILTSLAEPSLLAIFAGMTPAGKLGQPGPEMDISGGHGTLDGNS
jgi:hypothetical protein